MILYFTGTGNCLYVARELAAEGERVLSIPQELRREGELAYADDTIGIVYPIYGHMMPDMVKTFLERATLDTPYSLSRGAPSASWVLPQVDGKIQLAERVGFEPTDAFTSPVFKTGAFNRSAISPDNEFTSNSQTQE